MLDLDALNVNQRRAVHWNGGPMLVLAGPGAGKTRVLTTRFVAITRVQASLTLTHADSYFGWATRPSRFFQEMNLPSGYQIRAAGGAGGSRVPTLVAERGLRGTESG